MNFEKELPSSFLNKEEQKECLKLNEEQQNFITKEIQELIRPEGDRVCGDLACFFLSVTNKSIEMIVEEEEDKLKQKISRIKSRSATLLSFEFPESFSGKNTWGKGIWIAKVTSNNKAIQELITTYNIS